MKIVYTLVISIRKERKQRLTRIKYSSSDIKEIENEIKNFQEKYVIEGQNVGFSIDVEVDEYIPDKKEPKEKFSKELHKLVKNAKVPGKRKILSPDLEGETYE